MGTFISLLWVTAPEKEAADFYKAKLDEYRWMLQLLSKSADFLERAISMLAVSTGVLVKAMPMVPVVVTTTNRHSAGNKVTGSTAITTQSTEEVGAETGFTGALGNEYHGNMSLGTVAGDTLRSEVALWEEPQWCPEF